MRICYFYVNYFRDAVSALPLGAEFTFTGDTELSYGHMLRSAWDNGDDLMIVEQDIVIREDVLDQFENCPFAWCVYSYDGLTESLGCTRFRKELQKQVNFLTVPNALVSFPVSNIPERPLLFNWPGATRNVPCAECRPYAVCWRHLDLRLAGAIKQAGYSVHVHAPDVRHLK